MTAFNILSKAIKHEATQHGFEVEVNTAETFISLKGTNFGVAWLGGFHFEVITNYTKNKSWQHLRTNPVSGDYKTCLTAAIKKAKYWQRIAS